MLLDVHDGIAALTARKKIPEGQGTTRGMSIRQVKYGATALSNSVWGRRKLPGTNEFTGLLKVAARSGTVKRNLHQPVRL